MKEVIYVSDLDKTLLRDDISLSEYARDTLNRLIADGLKFTVATARSRYSMAEILKGLNLQLPVIGYNGALIADFHTGESLEVKSINKEALTASITAAKEVGTSLLVSSLEGAVNKVYYESVNTEGLQWWFEDRQRVKDPRLTQVDDIAEGIEEAPIGLTVIGREAEIKELNHHINSAHKGIIDAHCYENPYHAGWWWISANDVQATKGAALNSLKTMMDSAHSYTIFGDSINDISLFEESDRGIAPSTALPEIKEIADLRIGSNEEDAVVRFIEEEFYKGDS